MGDIDANLPEHIAIIMDGNGRWAKKRLLTKTAGHKAGAQALRKLAETADKAGLKYMSVYAFSTENWKRSEQETDGLMDLLRGYIQDYIDDADKNDIRMKVVGRRDRLAPDLLEKIEHLEQLTESKPGMTLIIALDYGSRDEILRAAKKFAAACKNGEIDSELADEGCFTKFLDTANIPDPQLLIRTSGEQRISNFLMWQLAYAEMYFTDKLWPDFKFEDMMEAVRAYNTRERRFGG
ncbi:MAG: isoprenyl transferase [Defluviitaleaceae bacterium]|nr:isoprenyl transferase [Defluviitaleaceae bacterium]